MRPAKRLLCGAVAAALLGGTAGAAHAVAVDPRGSGQVLLYPYYTVNGGNQTLVSVVNTTGDVKAVRVRFLEGRNSKSVLEFNLYLSPYDVWVAAVADRPEQQAAQLVPADNSCTVPRIDTLGAAELAFRNFQYTGINADFPPGSAASLSSLSRTREGHIEMIEMGMLVTGTASTQLAEEATIVFTGSDPATAAPADCNKLRDAFAQNGPWTADPTQNIRLPSGGLMGSAAIVDVAEGTMVSYDAVALADFYTDAAAPGRLHTRGGERSPSLADAANGGGIARTDLVAGALGPTSESYATGTNGFEAVSLALMQTTLLNDFVAEPAIGASTEWVVTFPTKRWHVDVATDGEVRAPFADAFRDDGRAEARVRIAQFDRAGYGTDDECEIATLPPPDCGPDGPVPLDNSVNVIELTSASAGDASAIFGSLFAEGARAYSALFPASGWNRVTLYVPPPEGTGATMIGPTTGLRYRGMPAIGFAATRIINSAARPGLLANYAGAQPHRGTLDAELIESSPQGREATR